MATIKCVLIGDEKIGKSSMLKSYTSNSFPEYYIPTIFDNCNCSIVNNGKIITLYLFDTSGSKDYDACRPQNYPKTDVILICFSVINSKSFRNVELKWLPEAKRFCPNAKIILVGTKIDLRHNEALIDTLKMRNEQLVTRCQGLEMAKKICALEYLECSARTLAGLEEVFKAASRSGLLPVEVPKVKKAFLKVFATLKRKKIKSKNNEGQEN